MWFSIYVSSDTLVYQEKNLCLTVAGLFPNKLKHRQLESNVRIRNIQVFFKLSVEI